MVPHSCMPRNLPWFHFIPHSAHLIHGNAVASTFKIYPESKHFSISLVIHSWLKTRLICLLELSSSCLSLRLPHGNWSDQSTNWILPCFCLITSCGFLINSLISSTRTPKSPIDFSHFISSCLFIYVIFYYGLCSAPEHTKPAPFSVLVSVWTNHSSLGLHTAASFSSFKSQFSTLIAV